MSTTIQKIGNLSERNRPRKFEDVIGNQQTISALRDMLARYKQCGEEPPHLMLEGMHGTGKTTIALIYADEYLGGIRRNVNFFEINGSDQRKIENMRDDVIPLTKICVKLIIFISEADKLTPSSQALLKRVMETTKNAKFIFDLNNESEIIEPIKSRCAEFKFRPLDPNEIVDRIYKVFDNEGIKYTLSDQEINAINYLVQSSKGDMRKIFNNLEKIITAAKELNPQNIMQLNESINGVTECLKQALAGDFIAAKNQIEDAYIMSGYDADLILSSIKDAIPTVIDYEKNSDIYVWAYTRLSELKHRMKSGGDVLIDLCAFVGEVWRAPFLSKK
jgi:DNA polymerase III delta prime subunit